MPLATLRLAACAVCAPARVGQVPCSSARLGCACGFQSVVMLLPLPEQLMGSASHSDLWVKDGLLQDGA
eukprot:14089600-Alexandrium_andersonii.AAC.1